MAGSIAGFANITVQSVGVSGSPDAEYTHDQALASNNWSITHNLCKFPSVAVVDSANTVVVGEVTYIDKNSLMIEFNGSFTGKAYLN